MKDPKRFYTYAYLRIDRTPYYIGKGSGNRIYKRTKRDIKPPKDKSRVIYLKQNLTEDDAFKHEKYMIDVFGRKDLGTGILYNKTNGGEGFSGHILNEKARKKLSDKKKGNKHHFYGKSLSEDHKRKQREANMGENNPAYGKKWWNDGNGNTKFAKECPEEGWVLGKGTLVSEETRRKLREANLGKRHSEKTKQKLSKLLSGKNHPNYGKMCPEETKRKISEKHMGKYISEESRLKMSEAKKDIKWWNDGNGNTKYTKECPGEGWIHGRGKLKSHKDT